MDDFGLTFSPSAAMNKDRASANADGNGPVQEAIRTLALRLPKVYGAQGMSPLMGGQGSQGIGAPGMGLEQLLARLFGQQGQQRGQQAPAGFMGGLGGSAPAPNVIPGLGGSAPTPRVTPGMEAPGFDPGAQPQPPSETALRPRMASKYEDVPSPGWFI